MDLTYPPEAEEFRTTIRAWLEENLPEGWGDDGAEEMSASDKQVFQKEWTAKLFDGGWICASWPTEYGGKGLSIMQNVVLHEEFARAHARCAPTSSATPSSARQSCNGGARSRSRSSCPASSRARSPGVRGSPNRMRGPTSPR